MMDNNILLESYEDKISNFNQIGGIELSTIRGGIGDGMQIAWFNTGSGLRFKVVISNGLNIADAFINQYNLSWISPFGSVISEAYMPNILNKQFYTGGLLSTGGSELLSNADSFHIIHYPAIIESVSQPDPLKGEYEMSICGKTLLPTLSGNHIELKRTISATLGKSKIVIKDRVINLGHSTIPYLFSYRCLFGYPLVDEDTHLIYNGKQMNSDIEQKSEENISFIDLDTDRRGFSECSLRNDKFCIEVFLKYRKNALPLLKTWQSYKKNGYMIGIEPGIEHPRFKQDKETRCLFLDSKEERSYGIEINVDLRKG